MPNHPRAGTPDGHCRVFFSTASTARRTLHIKTAMSAKNPNTPHWYNVISSMFYSFALWHVGAARASRPRQADENAAGSTAGRSGQSSQRLRPSYTVSPTGQRLKRSRPAVGAAQAVGRHKKAPPGMGCSSGAIDEVCIVVWPVLGHPQRGSNRGWIIPYKEILTKMVNEHNLIIRCRILPNTVQKCQ